MTRNIVTQSLILFDIVEYIMWKKNTVLFSIDGAPILSMNFDKHRHLIVGLQNIHTYL